MNTALTISIVVMVAAISGLVFGFLRRAQYPPMVRRRGVIVLLLGLAAGGLHALLDGGVVRHSSTLRAASTIVEIAFFTLFLAESIRLRRSGGN